MIFRWLDLTIIFQVVFGALPLFVVNGKLLKRVPEIVLLVFSSFVASILLLFFAILVRYNLHIFIGYLSLNALLTSVFFLRGFKANWHYIIVFVVSLLPFISLAIESSQTDDVEYSMLILWICTIIRSVLYKIRELNESKSNDETSKLRQHYNAILFLYTSASIIMTTAIQLLMSLDLWSIHNFIEILSKIATTYIFWRFTQQTYNVRDSK